MMLLISLFILFTTVALSGYELISGTAENDMFLSLIVAGLSVLCFLSIALSIKVACPLPNELWDWGCIIKSTENIFE